MPRPLEAGRGPGLAEEDPEGHHGPDGGDGPGEEEVVVAEHGGLHADVPLGVQVFSEVLGGDLVEDSCLLEPVHEVVVGTQELRVLVRKDRHGAGFLVFLVMNCHSHKCSTSSIPFGKWEQ